MNTLDLNQIDQLFGEPLAFVPKPIAPRKIETWQLVTGTIILSLAAYGAYTAYNNYIKANKPKVKICNRCA